MRTHDISCKHVHMGAQLPQLVHSIVCNMEGNCRSDLFNWYLYLLPSASVCNLLMRPYALVMHIAVG